MCCSNIFWLSNVTFWWFKKCVPDLLVNRTLFLISLCSWGYSWIIHILGITALQLDTEKQHELREWNLQLPWQSIFCLLTVIFPIHADRNVMYSYFSYSKNINLTGWVNYHLAKWLCVCFRTEWLCVQVQLQSLKLQILHLFRARSSLTFRQV